MVVITGASLSFQAPAFAGSDPAYDIHIPSLPVADALVDLAMQTNISIGGVAPARCGDKSVAVNGKMQAERALRLMLAGGHCDIHRFNARSFRLDLKPPRPAAVSARPVTEPDLDEVKVLVVRRPLALGSAPYAISLVPQSVLSESDLDLTNLAVRVPGMAVTNLGPGRDKILLRGVSDSVLTGRTQSTVGLYLDDSPITYNAPDPDLLLVDMARVEVLKGPQGALYGQGSLSGVVRLVTNKARTDIYESSLNLGVGLTEGGQVSSRVSAMVNLPVVANRLGVRTVLYQDNSGGFIEDQVLGKKSTNNTRRVGGRIAVEVPLNAHFSVTGTAVFQHIDSENSQYVSGQMGPYRRALSLAEPHDNSFEDLSLNLQDDLPAGTVKVAVNHLRHTISSGYDAQPLQRFVSIPTSGVLFYDEDQTISLSTAELSFLSPSEGRLRWFAGVFGAWSHEDFDPHLIDVYTANTLYNEARVDRVGDVALFGQLTYVPTEQWRVTLGLRGTYTHHETLSAIDHVRLTGYGMSGKIQGTVNDSHVAHRLLVSYKPHEGLLLYGQAADGFRTSGFNTTTQIVTSIPGVYSGDALSSYELGMRYASADSRLRFNLTAFQIGWKDIQSDQLRSTGLPYTANIGDGVNTGFEFEADWRVLRRLNLHLAAQTNDPRLRRPNPLFSKDKDRGMPFIARKSFSLSADWSQDLLRQQMENSLTLSYRSPSPLNYGPLRTVQMDAYTNLDMSTFVNFGKIRVGARLNNVTGVKSNSFAYGNPFSLEGSSQITPLRPRTLWLSVSRKY